MIVQALRSAIFYLQFFLLTAVLTIIIVLCTPFPKAQLAVTKSFAMFWTAWMKGALRWIVGIRTRVEGLENVPEGGALIASKHQSDWDVIALYPLLDHPAFIAKKELFDIPAFGTALRTLKTIEIDRSRGGAGIPGMIEQARETLKAGRKIFIFPEGTRKAPFEPANYRSGTTRMYGALDVPIVPVALNSGLTWGRNSLILWPGTATARFLEPVPPGLDEDEAQKLYTSRIEAETLKMSLEAVDRGVTRPLDGEMRDRIATARNIVAQDSP